MSVFFCVNLPNANDKILLLCDLIALGGHSDQSRCSTKLYVIFSVHVQLDSCYQVVCCSIYRSGAVYDAFLVIRDCRANDDRSRANGISFNVFIAHLPCFSTDRVHPLPSR